MLSLAETAEKQVASALGLLRLEFHSAHLHVQIDCMPKGQKDETLQRLEEEELQMLAELLMNLVEGLAVGILASAHCKLRTAPGEPLAGTVRRQAAGIPDSQAEVARKEAPCELAGLHSLCSHPQTNLTKSN